MRYNKIKFIFLIPTIIITLFSCNDCQNQLNEMALGEEFDKVNGEYHVYRKSNDYNSLVDKSKIDFIEFVSDYGQFDMENYVSRNDFDSLVYKYDSTGLNVEYFRLTSCYDVVPVLSNESDEVSIKCIRIQDGKYECKEGEVELVATGESCKNVMRYHIKVDFDKLDGKKINFQPQKDKMFDLVMNNTIDTTD